jgi:hypothetical protein
MLCNKFVYYLYTMKIKLLYALVSFIIAIQMYRPTKNIDAASLQTNAIATVFGIPSAINTIFSKACKDCHSNTTVYPWYANIQPVYSWLNNHVTKGKDEWNIDEFATYSLRKQYHKLTEIKSQITDNKMPLDSYTWMHGDAKISAAEKQLVINWVTYVQDSLQRIYPIDSLQRKKNN